MQPTTMIIRPDQTPRRFYRLLQGFFHTEGSRFTVITTQMKARAATREMPGDLWGLFSSTVPGITAHFKTTNRALVMPFVIRCCVNVTFKLLKNHCASVIQTSIPFREIAVHRQNIDTTSNSVCLQYNWKLHTTWGSLKARIWPASKLQCNNLCHVGLPREQVLLVLKTPWTRNENWNSWLQNAG